MNVYQLTESQVLMFGLVLMRMTAFVFSAALFSLAAVNVSVRVLLSLILALVIYPTLPQLGAIGDDLLIPFAAREVFLGLVLGFMTRLFFFAVSMTGEIVSISLGLSSAQLYNPVMGQQSGVIEQFHVLIGSLVFLHIAGHHIMITGLVKSFEMLPLATLEWKAGGLAEVAAFGADLLVLTVKMSAPVMVSILVANVAMGILGRAIPQINVLVTSFPVTIMLGLMVMFVCLPLFVGEMNVIAEMTGTKMWQLMKAL